MNTEKTFKKILYKKDVIDRTTMCIVQRSKFRAFFAGKNKNRKPKTETMEKFLTEYGYKKIPENWVM